jgi:hypothetical protein
LLNINIFKTPSFSDLVPSKKAIFRGLYLGKNISELNILPPDGVIEVFSFQPIKALIASPTLILKLFPSI